MPNLNHFLAMGCLTRDPEVRFTPAGIPVCSFALAINQLWRDDQGQQQKRTTFIDCEAWRRHAETIGEHCKKGTPIFIEGTIEMDEWTDKTTGDKRKRLYCQVDGFQFLLPRNGENREATNEERDADGNVKF